MVWLSARQPHVFMCAPKVQFMHIYSRTTVVASFALFILLLEISALCASCIALWWGTFPCQYQDQFQLSYSSLPSANELGSVACWQLAMPSEGPSCTTTPVPHPSPASGLLGLILQLLAWLAVHSLTVTLPQPKSWTHSLQTIACQATMIDVPVT